MQADFHFLFSQIVRVTTRLAPSLPHGAGATRYPFSFRSRPPADRRPERGAERTTADKNGAAQTPLRWNGLQKCGKFVRSRSESWKRPKHGSERTMFSAGENDDGVKRSDWISARAAACAAVEASRCPCRRDGWQGAVSTTTADGRHAAWPNVLRPRSSIMERPPEPKRYRLHRRRPTPEGSRWTNVRRRGAPGRNSSCPPAA